MSSFKTNKTTANHKMENIKTIDSLLINQFTNSIRKFFLLNDFDEVFLFDTTEYNITNTNQIKTSNGDLLRNTTEPEIWNMGLGFERFFCIASLFRKEDEDSLLHKNEFRIVDFYIKNANEKLILDTFLNLLKHLESSSNLAELSKLNVYPCDYEEFIEMNYSNSTSMIYKVENYPIDESFYDAVDSSTGKSKKSELFLVHESYPIEFGVLGQVDENKNSRNRIDNFSFQQLNIKSLYLYGMGFGIERIILCYNALKNNSAG